jgi:chromate reductase, NAD(P)H dehydrogenase (quinone)
MFSFFKPKPRESIMTRTIAVIVGSLRKDSLNRKIANAVIASAPAELGFTFVEIGDLPHFNQDLEATPPAQWVRFRDQVRAADAVLWVTPEYNRSVPGVLKNALDVGSRPYGQSVFDGKPVAVISSSMGGIGGFGANHHLRQSLTFLNMAILPGNEAYIGAAHTLFDDAGALTNEGTKKFLTQFVQTFAAWIETTAPASASVAAA